MLDDITTDERELLLAILAYRWAANAVRLIAKDADIESPIRSGLNVRQRAERIEDATHIRDTSRALLIKLGVRPPSINAGAFLFPWKDPKTKKPDGRVEFRPWSAGREIERLVSCITKRHHGTVDGKGHTIYRRQTRRRAMIEEIQP